MKKEFLAVAAAMALTSTTAAQAQSRLSYWFDTPLTMNGQQPWYGGHPERWTGGKKPISAGDAVRNADKEWEEKSLPIGNGSIGANIMGSIDVERMSLNEKTLWRGGPNTARGAAYYWNVNKQSAGVIPQIREAFAAGDLKRADQLTRMNFKSQVP